MSNLDKVYAKIKRDLFVMPPAGNGTKLEKAVMTEALKIRKGQAVRFLDSRPVIGGIDMLNGTLVKIDGLRATVKDGAGKKRDVWLYTVEAAR